MTVTQRRWLPAAYAAVSVTTVVLCGCGRQEEANEGTERTAAAASPRQDQTSGAAGMVALDSTAAARAGILTVPVERAKRGREIKLTGEVIPDSGRMITIRAPVAGRLVALDGAPWPRYGEDVAAGRVLCQVSDAKPLVAPAAGTVTGVRAVPGELVQPGQPLLEITDFREPLVRVVWRPDAPPSPPRAVQVVPLGIAGPGVPAPLVGLASEVDPLSRTPVYLYRAERSWAGARPGAPIEARFADPRVADEGLLIPTDAVVQWEGLAWVYVARGPRQYARELISTDAPVDRGYLVRSGVSPGDALVVRGAQQLLSEEFRARATTGDEPDQP